MDSLSFKQVFELAANLGVAGLVLLLWYLSSRDYGKLLGAYREDTKLLAQRYETDMTEIRHMYEANVTVVKQVLQQNKDIREVVLLNTSKWQQGLDAMRANEFCPYAEARRKGKGPET